MDINQGKEVALELLAKAKSQGATKIEFSLGDFEFSASFEKTVVHAAAPAVIPVTTPQSVAEVSTNEETAEPIIDGTPVTAPLVGTFYAAPSPDSPPFAAVGQTVKKGDVLCIVEAMKMMNEIESPCDGTIGQIFSQNGELVEFGQTIMVIQ